MNLIAHVIDGHQVDIRPAPVEPDWAKPRIKQTKSTSALGHNSPRASRPLYPQKRTFSA